MKEYSAKTKEDALNDAALELGVAIESLVYRIVDEKKGLFSKKVTIEVFDEEDASIYAEEYLKKVIAGLGIDIETTSEVKNGVIRISLNSSRNPVLIGKGGRTLQALNELTRLAVSNHFQHRYRVLLDVNGYKEDKYSRLAYLARKEARYVLRSHVDAHLDPMTPDERRAVHNALNGMEHIKTESEGEGNNRAVVIKYVE